METLNLLNPEREYYVIKEKFWDWGGGDIYDQEGTVIGKMKRKIFSLRTLITVMESDGRPVLTIHRKFASLRTSYDIKDDRGNLLGRTRKKILTFLHPKMWMEDAQGNKILEAEGSFAGWNFSIKDMIGQTIAEVHKADWWRDVFIGGPFDFSDTYVLHISDRNYDRRLLLGFVLAIDNSVHDKGSVTPSVGRPPIMID